jgi:hemerythrin-like domain-containing protein
MPKKEIKIKISPSTAPEVSVIDLLLYDHQYLKNCIKILVDESIEKRKKLLTAKGFVDALQKHVTAEKNAVYNVLENNSELHSLILEGQIEHGMIDQKVKSLKKKLSHVRSLKDEVEAEVKVLADFLNNHLMSEESEMFPKMQESLERSKLIEMGTQFMRLRKISTENLAGYPLLEDELINWKDSVQRLSSQFLSRMDRYVESMKH